MTVLSIVDVDSGVDLLWRHPSNRAGQLPAELGPSGAQSRVTFERSVFVGGWFAMFPNLGPTGTRTDLWFHGEAPRRAWQCTSIANDRVIAELALVSMPVVLTRSVSVRGSSVLISTTARSRGPHSVQVAAGEHPCFDRRSLGISELTLGMERMTLASDEQVEHIVRQGSGSAFFDAQTLGKRVTLTWDTYQLPAVLTWRLGGSTVAVEPRSVEARRADEVPSESWWELRPNGELSWQLTLTLSKIEQAGKRA